VPLLLQSSLLLLKRLHRKQLPLRQRLRVRLLQRKLKLNVTK
jgi:hypothetical protein